MASSNFSFSGHTGVIQAACYVSELTTSGTSRRVRVRISVWAKDYSGNRDSSYSVKCTESGTNTSVGMYQGFYINGSEQDIFDETFYVSVAAGSSTASISLSFSASLYSSSAGATRSISGSVSTLYLTEEPAASASSVSVGASSVQMGKNLTISISRDDGYCTHTLTYAFGSASGTIATGVATSHAWTVPDLAAYCNNSTSGTCTITCTTYRNGTYIGTSSVTVTLTVPDPTTPSISGSEVTMGSSSTITCTRNSSNFTVRLTFEFQGTAVDITEGKVNSCSWTPSYDFAKQIPALTYATGTLKCVTLNGTAEVGTKTATIRATVPENSTTRPSFVLSGLALSPISDLGSDFTGLYLRGKTGLKAEFTASSTYSTLKTYSITVGSLSAEGNPATIDLLVNEGDVKVTAKVTDARGFSTTVNTTISILPYRKPKVTPYTGYSNVVCERALSSGALDPSGTYLAIKAGKSYSSVVLNGVEKNGCKLQYRWKISSSGTYSSWSTLLAEGSTQTEISLLVGNIVSSLSTSYDVEIKAEDSLGGVHTLTFAIMTEAVSFVLYDGVDGAGFGKYPEEPHVVDIAAHMTLRVRGKLVVDSADWVNLDLASGINESVYSYGRKEDSGCHYQVTDGNHIYIAFNCAFSFAGSAKVINSTVIPAAHRPPRTVYTLCPINDRGIALVSVNADGYIRVEWVQNLTDTVLTGSTEVIWIDGYLDYWT